MQKILKFTARNDYAFKKLFGTEKNKAIMIDFVCTVTGLDKDEFKAVQIKNPYLSPQHIRDKSSCLDVHIELKSGSKINIEMQNVLLGDFTERTMYYWAKTLIEGFTRSANYSSLRKTICINIVNQPFKLTNKVQSIYKVLEVQECTILTELLEIQF